MQKLTAWLKKNNRRALLGLFAAADNATCTQALEKRLADIDANRAVWAGWAWWTDGPWCGDHMFALEPRGGQDAPQTASRAPNTSTAPERERDAERRGPVP